jgi:subfamily B ATP-binding cassette protein MsbA
MISDVTEIETSVMRAIKDGIKAPITIVIYFVTLIFMNAHLTLFVVLMLPVTGFVIGRIGKSLRRKSTRSQNKLGYILSLIEESLFGLMIIKGFNAEEKFKNSFKKENEDYYRLMNKVWRRKDLASPVSEYLSTIVIVVVMFYGGNMVLNHTTTLAPQSFITYLVIFSQIISPAKQFSNSYYDIQRGLASYDRIKWLLSAPVTIKNISHPVSFNGFQKAIEYRDVGFSYGDKKVLDHFNLTIEKGKTIALVGQSGAGKTTVANLLPRFWDVNSGAILMDGLDIRHMDIRVLRDQLGIVSQESILFNDTNYNNISFGIENISEKQVIQAAKIANAHRFIVETEAGYQTLVGDRGSKLSGGQRQRISIARAVLKNPSILILDEATSALDTESEAYVQDAIEKLMSNRTAIIIAHRLSTIKNADEIVVMDEGKIVERGRHNELLQQNGVYANLHNMQVFK